eukprot:12938649-Prorocentrum_lima.AAC.1
MELMKKVDAHSSAVAQKVYSTMSPGDDAMLGKNLHQQLFGDPVAWPSEDIITLCDAPGSPSQLRLVPYAEQDGGGAAEEEEEEEEHDFILTPGDVEEKRAGKEWRTVGKK